MFEAQKINSDYSTIIASDSTTKALLSQFEELTKIYANLDKSRYASLVSKRLKNENYKEITLDDCCKFYSKLTNIVKNKEKSRFYYEMIKELSNDLLVALITQDNKKGKISLINESTICIKIKKDKYKYTFFEPVNALSIKYEADFKAITNLIIKDLAEKAQSFDNIFKPLHDAWQKNIEIKESKHRKRTLFKNIVTKFSYFFAGFFVVVVILLLSFFAFKPIVNSVAESIKITIDSEIESEIKSSEDTSLTKEDESVDKYNNEMTKNAPNMASCTGFTIRNMTATMIATMIAMGIVMILVLLIREIILYC